jgi:hypothetical protein
MRMVTLLQLELRIRMGGAVPSLFHVSKRHVPRLLFVIILNGWLYTSGKYETGILRYSVGC